MIKLWLMTIYTNLMTPRYLVVQHDHVTGIVRPVARYYRLRRARGRALRETAAHFAETMGAHTRFSWEVETRASA
jgi:hypothetical protein